MLDLIVATLLILSNC